MRSDGPSSFASFRGKPVLLDSNLLVVVFVGLWRPELVGERVTGDEYDFRDVELLAGLVERARPWVVTSHILTEVDDRIDRVGEGLARDCRRFVARLLERIRESRPSALSIVQESMFERIGLADSGAKRLARTQACFVVTVDHALHEAIAREGNATAYYPAVRAFRDA